MELYFAYGSNLAISRMQSRVPTARIVGRARLASYRLTFDKRGRDGSGKANIAPDPQHTVWGALYALEPTDWNLLDGFETGYDRVTVEVILETSESHVAEPRVAQTYRAIVPEDGLTPFAGYKRFITEGAREHGLPEAYRATLEALPSLPE